MKLILDASVAIKWVLPEADSAKALSLLDDVRNNVHELLAPDTFGVFDCLYVALAKREGCRVVRADQRMVALFSTDAVPLASL